MYNCAQGETTVSYSNIHTWHHIDYLEAIPKGQFILGETLNFQPRHTHTSFLRSQMAAQITHITTIKSSFKKHHILACTSFHEHASLRESIIAHRKMSIILARYTIISQKVILY